MTSQAPTASPPQGGKPKRHLRNYLLDPRFQLKYTGMVVLVTVVVASVLGSIAYRSSKAQTESLTIQMAMMEIDAPLQGSLEEMSAERDREVLLNIVGGIVLMGVILGLTGIIVTHRLVGPAYKLRLLIHEVASGKLKIMGKLRKGDELQEVFEAFAEMITSLRAAQAKEIAELDAAIAHAREAGVPMEHLEAIQGVRDRMQAAID
ncbi:MAG: hypothetical protein H6725_08185 [Sandaracinaceae bacterium]|nr:hypothetical protein [Sandaracinaceae bacterium]